MAIAPHLDRVLLLGLALNEAKDKLGPIDRVEVTRNKVFVWAGREGLALSYGTSRGATLGSGSWVITRAEAMTMPTRRSISLLSFLWRNVAARWPKGGSATGKQD